MSVTLNNYKEINNFLANNGIDTILYGSLGVSSYLGNFREFDDIDLLIDKEFLGNKWEFLKGLMNSHGFRLENEKEHEFIDNKSVKVAFAAKDVLVDDNICDPKLDVVEIENEGIKIKTLNVKGFLNAYTFSSADGYRFEKRGDNDTIILRRLKKLIDSEIEVR